MGCYVNPENESKESFLNREGVLYDGIPKWNQVPDKMMPVVLLNNGLFTAAGVAYKESELGAFTDPRDIRPKKIYFVPIEKLWEVSDLRYYLDK